MMRKQFFAITLEGQQKYDFKPSESIMFHQVTMVSIKQPDTNIQIYGQSGDNRLQLTTVNDQKTSAPVKITINEDNFQTIYAVGDGTVDLSGYSLVKSEY